MSLRRRLRPYPASRAIAEKIEAKHRISWDEIEEVFRGKLRLFRTHRKDQYGESRYLALGRTKAGRYLTIFFISVLPDQAKVITARDMDRKERHWFSEK